MTWRLTYPDPAPVGACVAMIGNFDGVHAGHRALAAAALAAARRHALPLVALTFDPHPRTVLHPHVPLTPLTTLDQRQALLGACGADGLAVLPFTPALAQWTPAEFAARILKGWLNAGVVAVGENFRFGHQAAGTPETLRAAGLEVVAVPLLRDAGGVVSSSRLRGEVEGGG